jgi:membrane protein implicated in regulation of membrane protease activity
MDSGGWNWAIIDILLPAILVVVLLWAFLRNRSSRREIDRSEQATRDLYREEEERRRSGDDGHV